MPRRPRIKLAGIPQHIVQRGINREPCFFAEEDYHSYLHWLEKAAADWRCFVHAYVLMTNHVHLLITPETEAGTAKLMQAVGRRYVQYINRSYKRTGSLWEGRYKSSVIQAETCLLSRWGRAASVTGCVQRQVSGEPRSGRVGPRASRVSQVIRMRKVALDSEQGMERQMAVRKMNARLPPLAACTPTTSAT